jgi:hypothetical protein
VRNDRERPPTLDFLGDVHRKGAHSNTPPRRNKRRSRRPSSRGASEGCRCARPGDRRGPSPWPSPPGRGDRLSRAVRVLPGRRKLPPPVGATPTAAAPVTGAVRGREPARVTPSPRGEGWGEGDRDAAGPDPRSAAWTPRRPPQPRHSHRQPYAREQPWAWPPMAQTSQTEPEVTCRTAIRHRPSDRCWPWIP